MSWTTEEIANLHDMLLSNDSRNQLLAIELIKSKGDAQPFEAVLFFLEACETYSDLAPEFTSIIQILPPDTIKYWRPKFKVILDTWSSTKREFLSDLEAFKSIMPICDDFFRKAPQYVWFYSDLGSRLIDLKKKTVGLEFLKKAVELNPESLSTNLDYARRLPKQKRYADEIIKHYQKCIEMGSTDVEVYRDLCKVYATLKKTPQKGVEAIHQGLANIPKSAFILMKMAFVLNEIKEHDQACALLEESIALDPSYSLSYNNLAFTLWNAYKDYEKARFYIEKALELAPKEGLYWHTLAEIEWYGYQDKTKALAALYKAKEDNYYTDADTMIKELESL